MTIEYWLTKTIMDIKIVHEGEDYICISINGLEKELYKHDGKAIRFLLKAISTIFKAYA